MTVRVLRFSEDWRSRWAAFTEANRWATLAHAEQWLSIIPEALGHRERSLIAQRDGEICGILPMMLLGHRVFGTYHVSLPWLDYGGVLADDAEITRALLDSAIVQAREDGARFVELRTLHPDFFDLPCREDKITYWLPLRDSDGVWRSLDPKVRNQVRKAEKAGLTCHFGREELLPEFYRIFARNMRDLGTPVWSIALFENILRAFPKTAEIALIRTGKKAVGGGLVLTFRDTVHMPSASSLRSYFHLCPNNLLYWEVIKRACEAGFRCFDFGRSTVASGTSNFKKQWGPEVKSLHWRYVLLDGNTIPHISPSNPRFKILIEAWKRLPLPIANWMGPRIVRHLP